MMSDIDKNIEILEEFKENGFASLMIKYNKNRIQTNTMVKMAIENVLSDREFLKDKVNWYSKEYDKLFDENNKSSKETKTWEKIAEKLADIFATNENDLCKYLNIIDKCKAYAGENKKTCNQCIINWAKNEVLKDE